MSKTKVAIQLMFSVAGGALATGALLLLVAATDRVGGRSGIPLTERHPFAWVIAWPQLFTNSEGAILLINALLYSALLFFVLYKRSRPVKLR
jgi:hypothetical protein